MSPVLIVGILLIVGALFAQASGFSASLRWP